MALLVLAFVGFIVLGSWQVRRYHLKLRIAHDVATRVHAPPVAAPGPAQWNHIAAGHEQYLHVKLHGRFMADAQTLVRGASTQGYGYWVMTPLRTDRGFIVLVNRGYIPSALPGTPGFAKTSPPAGDVTLTGLLRSSEPGGSFLRRNDPATRQWYSRDVTAIADAHRLPANEVAPYFVDADAATNGRQWPAGGLTKIHFWNHSLGYAIIWYLLALGMLLAVGITIRHERRAGRSR